MKWGRCSLLIVGLLFALLLASLILNYYLFRQGRHYYVQRPLPGERSPDREPRHRPGRDGHFDHDFPPRRGPA